MRVAPVLLEQRRGEVSGELGAARIGRILREELRVDNDLVILDGIALRDFDYVDLGRVREPSGTVPVTIKSLVFDAHASMSQR